MPLPRKATIADRIPIKQVMTRDPVTARPDLDIDSLCQLFVDHHIGCVPIVDDRGKPQGIVTKLDIVERANALTAAEVMMPLAITLNSQATIAHAAAMMSLEDCHHMLVVGADHRLIGVVSSLDIVRWLAQNDGFTGS